MGILNRLGWDKSYPTYCFEWFVAFLYNVGGDESC